MEESDTPQNPTPQSEPELDPRTGLPKVPPPPPLPNPVTQANPAEPQPQEAPKESETPIASPPLSLPPPAPEDSPEEIEKELKKWNWGAFFLTWIWGIANQAWIALLALIPFLTVPMMIVLGLKGNAWAWKNKGWYSLAAFRDNQKKWAKWGLVFFVGLIIFFIVLFSSLVLGITGTLKKTEPYITSLQIVQSHAEVQEALGAPLKAGKGISGNAQFSGPEATVSITYKVQGPKDFGTVHVNAFKKNMVWKYDLIGIEIGKEKRQINLTPVEEVVEPVAPPIVAEVVEAPKPTPQPIAKPQAPVQEPSKYHTILLANGTEIEGRIVKEDEAGVTIDVQGMGPIVFGRGELAKTEQAEPKSRE